MRKLSLSAAPLLTSLAVILALALFMAIFWTANEYQAFRESIANIRQNYNEQYHTRAREEIHKVVDFIEYQRAMSENLVEAELRRKVQSAYTLASHMYRMYKDTKSVEELRVMVAEILRPIRWNRDRGYYFTAQVTADRVDLFADEPGFEGQPLAEVKDREGNSALAETVEIVREKGAALYRHELHKPLFPEKSFSKLAFVKYFAPFDWLIGAGVYDTDVKEALQEELLHRIQQMRFGSNGRAMVFRRDGTIICDADDQLVGRSMLELTDADGTTFGKTLLEIGTDSERKGYLTASVHTHNASSIHQKLYYVEAYRDWDWILAASVSMEGMQQAIQAETETYRRISFRNVFLFILLFSLAVFLMLISSYFFSLKLKKGFRVFTDFFSQAADSKKKIDNTGLVFTELEFLGQVANKMIDELVRKENLLHRDELRLDTLLHLGMMPTKSLEQKYDFILRRIIRITDSEGGYLALINTQQSHLTICAYSTKPAEVVHDSAMTFPLTNTVTDGGLPGLAVQQRQAVINNEADDLDRSGTYPYTSKILRHLDVPVVDGDKVVLVAGVINKPEPYDTSDARQVTMLLEGMWLHVIRTCSEKEMERLERQIIAVSEQERAAIGRDLHDDLGSHLSGIEMLSRALQKKLEKEHSPHSDQLGTVRTLIREAIEKTRSLAYGLYPVHVIEQGLEASLEKLAAEIENLFSTHCTVHCDGKLQWADNNTANHVYYIIREAAFNAARHGQPDTVAISTKAEEEQLWVVISDDGCGFDTATGQKGIGLYTMQYRAKAVGATLHIESKLGQGTLVTLHGEVLYG
ncbi:MAG: hypothetical protein CSA34_00925 [Desulfobulbus propionicus]|nr:MAG: hypothetical protein CSA34_00925 [Desulfobulbus propionicus]